MFYFILIFVIIACICGLCIAKFSKDDDDIFDEYSEKDEWDNFWGH